MRLPREEILALPPVPAGSGHVIGASRQGRSLVGYRLGSGPLHVSLIAGCHADEPVGPAMLDRLAHYLATRPEGSVWLTHFTWSLIPHMNPDGEERNVAWSSATRPLADHSGDADIGYDLAAYLGQNVRELPGDDVEFGFPESPEDSAARPENRAATDFLVGGAPFHFHASFHGMGFASGPWFLLEPFWVDRTRSLRAALTEEVAALGYGLHEVDRHGEKGFWRISEGFTTRPDSRSMRDYFLSRDEPTTAARFRPSSMELVRSLGGDPLTVVSEMPLFLVPDHGPLAEAAGDRLRRLEILNQTLGSEGIAGVERLGVRPMPLRDQMRLQLALLDEGLALVRRYAQDSAISS